MCSRTEQNRSIAGERFVCIHGKSVEIAERRHCPDFRIREQAFEFRLFRQSQFLRSESFAQNGKIHFRRSGQYCHHELIIRFDHNGFGYNGSWNTFRRRDLLGCVIAVGWTR